MQLPFTGIQQNTGNLSAWNLAGMVSLSYFHKDKLVDCADQPSFCKIMLGLTMVNSMVNK